jgi:RNA-directed DNA polymerase
VAKALEEVPDGAVPSSEADPLGFVNRQVWTDRMLEALRKGGPEGGRWYWLHDKVFCERTLRVAYAQVAANQGAPGVDGVTVEAFGERLDEEISRLLASWKAGTFRPQAIRRKWIPKPGSDERRPLGIPTVRDRVVQAALRLVLEPIFEMDFHPSSHGFRPGRKAQDALSAVVAGLKDGKVWVVDADLKRYFDTIPHGPLLKAVHRRVTDRRILGLIEQFLKAGIMEEGKITEPDGGTPQGGVISPLLANIYLNDLDHQMASQGRTMIRYADDFVILCRSEGEAKEALAEVQRWTAQAGLQLHPTKTRLVDLGQLRNFIDFLGYRLQRHHDTTDGKIRILRLVRPSSLAKLTEKIRVHTKRTKGIGLPEIIGGLNQTLRGWFVYFRSAHQSIHHRLDQTIRRRLRAILAKRRGCPNWGGGRGHNRWPNAFFAKLGLLSLEEACLAHRQPC